MQKNSCRGIQYFVLFLIIFIPLIAIGSQIYFGVFEKQNKVTDFLPNTIKEIRGYSVEGDLFTQVSEDPQLLLDSFEGKIKKIQIIFEKPVEQDFSVEIYLADNYNFNEENMILKTVKKGETELCVYVKNDLYNTVRCDLNGNFELKYIECNYVAQNENFILLSICLIIPIVLGSFIFIIVLKKHIIQESFQTTIKKIDIKIENIKLIKWLNDNVTVERYFVFIAAILGSIMMFIIPAFQTPDEHAHFNYMQSELGLEGYVENAIESYHTPIKASEISTHEECKQNLKTYIEYSKVRFDSSLKRNFKPNIKIVRHLAANIGLTIGILLDFPIYWCLQLAELFALAFYIIVCRYAIKIMPFKKHLLAFIMLLPMSLQQAGSINYDSMLLPACFLFVSYVYYLAYVKKEVSWKSVAVLIIDLFIIVIIKFPYALLAVLVLIIPYEKIKLHVGRVKLEEVIYKIRWFLIGGMTILGVCGIYVCRNSYYVKICLASMLNIPKFFCILINTLQYNWKFYAFSTVGGFGWLDSRVAFWFIALAGIMFVVLCANMMEEKLVVKRKTKFVSVITFIMILVIIFLSMITWTLTLKSEDLNVGLQQWREYIDQIDVIEGVQGRYFVPILLLLGISGCQFNKKYKMKEKVVLRLVFFYYAIMIGEVLTVLLQRYWIM